MNPDDLRDRDKLTRMLRRPLLGDPVVKPTTPELMDRLTRGFRDEYDEGTEGRQQVTRALFTNNERKDGA